ncbi:MAG: long-chain fatty acid--CoA ligase, partial [bacterium]|nr:long-chain fatty acid--CoA ligase [bacterium]
LEDYIKETGISLVITDKKCSEIISGISFEKEQLHTETQHPMGQVHLWTLNNPGNNPYPAQLPAQHENRTFILQFTSGTGGKSKIVPRTYRNIAAEITGIIKTLSITPSDITACPAPLFHSYGLLAGFLSAYYSGATFLLIEKFIPKNAIKMVEQYKPTIFNGIPFMYNLLVNTFQEKEPDFSSLRYCLSAGAKLSDEAAGKFKQKFDVPIVQLYGTTETGVIAVNADSKNSGNIHSVGKALAGRSIKIVDENNRELPSGAEGEISTSGSATTAGYLNRPELNTRKFKDQWYYTGDIGHLDEEENLYITGRKSNFINVAGLKVDPFQVEQVLAAHNNIKECAVVGIMDEKKLEEKIKCYVVTEKDMTVQDVRKVCIEKLADYKVPREVEFVAQLPRSATGKVQLKYLIK